MTRKLLRAIALTLFSSLPGLAHAGTGEKAVIADCDPGGCRCSLSSLNLEEASIVAGVELPSDAQTLVIYGKRNFWTRLNAQEVDSRVGGDGRCDLELFGPILPNDGFWSGTVRTTRFAGCPQQVAEAVPTIVKGMLFSRDVKWQGAFHPAQLSMKPSEQPVTWTGVSPTVFRGALNPIGQSKALGISGALLASLVSEDSVVTTFRFTVMGCQVDAIYDFKRRGG